VYYTENGTDWTALSEDSVVSMNCWCFPRSFMDELTGRFVEFLQANGNSQTAEYFLPFVVKELLEEGRCRVQVLKTGAKWFGVTYREDREMVASAIGEMVRSGIYPENLWAAFLPQVDR